LKERSRRKKEKTGFDNNAGMALSFGALNIADYLTTKKILNSGGEEEEYNPIAFFYCASKIKRHPIQIPKK
jgi:hypothetical protein